MALLLVVVKVAFVGLLLFLFFTFFGVPALQRYLEEGVLLKVSSLSHPSGGLLPPTITLCPTTPNKTYEAGWKNASGEYLHVLQAECEKLNNHDDVLNCVNDKTYTFDEAVKNVFVGVVQPEDLMNTTYWSKYMTVTGLGKCQVLKYEKPLGMDAERDSLFLYLNPDLNYYVFFHDTKYFLTTNNLLTIPQIMIRKMGSQASKSFDYYPLSVTKRKNINRPSQPCVEDVNYDFTDCIIESVAAKIGCKYPWDTRAHSQVPVCTDVGKITTQEEIFYKIGYSGRKNLINITGCQPPCSYRHYEVVGEPFKGIMPGYGVGIMFMSTEFTLEEEDFVYPLTSLVAEFGGALGLFLGFSFLMVWDFVYGLIKIISKNIK